MPHSCHHRRALRGILLCALVGFTLTLTAPCRAQFDLDTRRWSRSDLDGMTDARLDILRNIPYARHGLRFQRADLRNYFNRFPWYRPDSGSQSIVERRLTRTEAANVALILRYQRAHRPGNRRSERRGQGRTDGEEGASIALMNRMSDSRLTNGDIERVYNGTGAMGLAVLRNIPYARRGYRFNRADLRREFDRYAWYRPRTDNANAVERAFNRNERANILLIQDYERAHGIGGGRGR